jgi:hypothetical protein
VAMTKTEIAHLVDAYVELSTALEGVEKLKRDRKAIKDALEATIVGKNEAVFAGSEHKLCFAAPSPTQALTDAPGLAKRLGKLFFTLVSVPRTKAAKHVPEAELDRFYTPQPGVREVTILPLLLLMIVFFLPGALFGQTLIDYTTQIGNKPIEIVASLPGSCTAGKTFFHLNGVGAQRLYVCSGGIPVLASGSGGGGGSMTLDGVATSALVLGAGLDSLDQGGGTQRLSLDPSVITGRTYTTTTPTSGDCPTGNATLRLVTSSDNKLWQCLDAGWVQVGGGGGGGSVDMSGWSIAGTGTATLLGNVLTRTNTTGTVRIDKAIGGATSLAVRAEVSLPGTNTVDTLAKPGAAGLDIGFGASSFGYVCRLFRDSGTGNWKVATMKTVRGSVAFSYGSDRVFLDRPLWVRARFSGTTLSCDVSYAQSPNAQAWHDTGLAFTIDETPIATLAMSTDNHADPDVNGKKLIVEGIQ